MFNLLQSTLPFLAFYVTGALTFVVYILYNKWYYIPKLKETNMKLAPERRLELAIYGSIFIPASLLIFGWSGQYDYVHWIVPTIGAALYVSVSSYRISSKFADLELEYTC